MNTHDIYTHFDTPGDDHVEHSVDSLTGYVDRSDAIIKERDSDCPAEAPHASVVNNETVESSHVTGLKSTRKKPRRKQVHYDTAQTERIAVTASHEDDVIDLIDIERALNSLSVRQRYIYLSTMAGKTRDYIAKDFGLTPRRIGQIQAEICDAIDSALAVRLPGSQQSSHDCSRHR